MPFSTLVNPEAHPLHAHQALRVLGSQKVRPEPQQGHRRPRLEGVTACVAAARVAAAQAAKVTNTTKAQSGGILRYFDRKYKQHQEF